MWEGKGVDVAHQYLVDVQVSSNLAGLPVANNNQSWAGGVGGEGTCARSHNEEEETIQRALTPLSVDVT